MRNAPSADDVIIEDPIAREIFESIRRRDAECARRARRGRFQNHEYRNYTPRMVSREKFRVDSRS